MLDLVDNSYSSVCTVPGTVQYIDTVDRRMIDCNSHNMSKLLLPVSIINNQQHRTLQDSAIKKSVIMSLMKTIISRLSTSTRSKSYGIGSKQIISIQSKEILCRTFHLTAAIHNSNINEDDDNKEIDPMEASREWVPPRRPLSGDLGRSDAYATKTPKNKRVNTPSSVEMDNNDIMKQIENHENTGENVQFVDLDNIYLDELENNKISFISSAGDVDFFDDDDDDDDESIWEEIDDDDEQGANMLERDEKLMNEMLKAFDIDDEDLKDISSEMIEKRLQQVQSNMKDKQSSSSSSSQYNKPDFINEENSQLDDFLKQQNEEGMKQNKSLNKSSNRPDWLSTRRSRLSPTHMLTPDESSRARSLDEEIPVIKNTLLSSKEIVSCLTNLGADNVQLVIPDKKTLPFLGWQGLIIATGSSFSHIRVLTDAIVTNLQKRNLAKRGVIGALYGSEGGEDTITSKKRRRGMPKKMDDGWICVDCGNFIIHVQDDLTRRSIDLESLWSPGKRGKAGRELRALDTSDVDAVDEYIVKNPVPDEYTESLIDVSSDFWSDGQNRGGLGLAKKQSGRWTPSSNEKRKHKNRGKR